MSMPSPAVTRRQVLAALGVGAGAAAIASCSRSSSGDGGQVVRHHQQGRGGHGARTSRGGLRLATHAGLCGGLLLIAGGGVGVGLDVGEQVEGLAAQGGVEPGDRLVEQEVAR